MLTLLHTFLLAVWRVTEEMAPYLLLGFLLAGVLSVLISPAVVQRHLGARGWRQVVKAALLGVPLPLCSCGVLPLTVSLRRQGASPGASLAFLIATPQTGVDSYLATHALMGPFFALARVFTALVSGILGGMLLERLEGPVPAVAAPAAAGELAPRRTWRGGLRYGLFVLPRAIGRAMLIGIVLSGLIMAAIPESYFVDKLGPGLVSMLVMLLVGLPLYVCSTGSIPLAYAFMHMGLSPGAAFVFLVSGPATSAAALVTIHSVLGTRAVVVCVITVAVSAVAGGLLVDQLVTAQALLSHAHTHAALPPVWRSAAAVALLLLLAPALRPRR